MATSIASLQSKSQTDWPLRFVDAGPIKTAYYRAGKGPPLILIHGGGAGADSYGNWRSCIDDFAAHFDTIAVDLVGFGNSSKPDAGEFAYDQRRQNPTARGFHRCTEHRAELHRWQFHGWVD